MTTTIIIAWILVGLWPLLMLCSMFMMYRNNWVYTQRVKLLFEDYAKFECLQSYKVMMRRWWIWDIDKFIDRKPTPEPSTETKEI